MERKLLCRDLIAPPEPDAIPAGLLARLSRASAHLPALLPVAPSRVLSAPAASMAPLRHELSDAYLARNGAADAPVRTDAEHAALDAHGASLAAVDRAAFADALVAINGHVTDGAGGWRCGQVGTVPDRHGNRIVFPSRGRSAEQIERIRELLARRDIPAVFVAAMTLALLTNCHPFRDGNGRVARLMFNHALRRGGMPPTVYIAFSEFARRSDGGYLIALRKGELRGDWTPYLAFVLTMLDVHRTLMRRDATDANAA